MGRIVVGVRIIAAVRRVGVAASFGVAMMAAKQIVPTHAHQRAKRVADERQSCCPGCLADIHRSSRQAYQA